MEQENSRELLRFTTAGSVDDGKSTLIGRLLYDSKQLMQDQLDELERYRQHRGEADINLALITDGLRAEREQGITIDVAYRYFSTPKRKFIIADTPGHVQYTRNMVTGASTADLAIILIDARNGVITQSRRHGFIASLLGIPHLLVAVNKMDLVDYAEDVFRAIVHEYTLYSEKLDVHDIVFVPVSALNGDNIVDKSTRMPWFEGATIMHHLENVTISADRNLVDFRFPVQYVLRPHQDFRGFAGRVVSGTIRSGEEITVLPSRKRSRVAGIMATEPKRDTFGVEELPLLEAFESQSVVLTLEDEIDISRGDMLVRRNNVPIVANQFEAILCWMDDEKPMSSNTRYLLQHTTKVVQTYRQSLIYRINVDTLHREPAESLTLNEIGRVELTVTEPLAFDAYRNNRATGSFILIDPVSHRTVAAGMIRYEHRDAPRTGQSENAEQRNIRWEDRLVGREAREKRNGHQAAVVWLTGLSGSGKTTIARQVEAKLFESGHQTTLLDGDNIRYGLNEDLGFSAADRSENIRRIGRAAEILFESGMIVFCSFISPYRADRERVKAMLPAARFVEIFVDASLDECIRRDTKGLYARALAGEIPDFTGISAPYEVPEAPDLTVNTEKQEIDHCVHEVIELLRSRGFLNG